MEWTMDAIKKLADENPNGFTVNVETGSKLIHGHAVALTHSIKIEDAAFLANNWILDAEYGLTFGCATHTLGGWKSPSGEYMIDLGLIIKDEEEALDLAKQYYQYSIYNLDDNAEIVVD